MKTICTLAAAASLTAWSVVGWTQQETQRPGFEREMQTQTDLTATSTLGEQRSANKLIGMDVQNMAGENLGSVDDIILDDQQGRIAYAVVSSGGILGIGEKHHAVPWQAFSIEQEDALTLDIAKDKLSSAPSFDKGELPDQSDPEFHRQAHEFYGTEPYDVSQAQREREIAQQTAETQEQDDESWDWKFWTARGDDEDWARRLSEVIGTEVVDRQNEPIGDIDDLAIDTREGRVTYALVGYGGMEMQTAAVPWSALELNEDQEQYSLDATTEDLEIAKLSSDELEKLQDEQASRTIHETFDAEPYWIAYGYDEQQGEWQSQSRTDTRTQMQRQSEQVALRGTVENVQEMQAVPGQTAESGVQVQLRTDTGQTEMVHLASRQAMEQQNVELFKGDRIEVEGIREKVRGQSMVNATEVSKDGRTVTFEPRQTGAQQLPGSQRANAPGQAQTWPVDEPRQVAGQRDASQQGRTQPMGETPEFAQGDVSLAGTIETVEEFRLMETGTEQPDRTSPLGESEEKATGLHLQLETEDGQTEILHISSAQALEDQNIDLSEGQDVEIEGFRTRYLGEPVIEVTQLTVDGQTIEIETTQERDQVPLDSI